MSDIVTDLRARREFFSLDGDRWYTSDKPDRDCASAADEIDRLRAELQEARAALTGTGLYRASSAVVSHWNEFGPEYGFERVVDVLDIAVRGAARTAAPIKREGE